VRILCVVCVSAPLALNPSYDLRQVASNACRGWAKNDDPRELDLATALFEGGQALRAAGTAYGVEMLDRTGNKLYTPLWTTGRPELVFQLPRKVVPPGGSAEGTRCSLRRPPTSIGSRS
jgi:hypothetical protein